MIATFENKVSFIKGVSNTFDIIMNLQILCMLIMNLLKTVFKVIKVYYNIIAMIMLRK